ncbi:MAG: TolC family protein [Desulfobacula sp.]|nr:TolC family protein [Desulfobacula sp.]
MKRTFAAILILCTLIISPLYADYSQMNKNLENYSPPGHFNDSLKLKNEKDGSKIESRRNLEAVITQIQARQLEYEKKIKKDNDILFLPGVDTKLFLRLVKIADDKEAVKKILNQNVILDEIEVLSALRNPAILSAQKKVKAEIESFNQVLDLDENLKQYAAFTKDINNKTGPLKMKDSIKLKYPFPGLTSLKGRVVNDQVATLLEKMKIVRKNVITNVRKAYWNLVFIEKSITITTETIDAFERLKDVATVLYKSGKTSFQDIIKINIEIEILIEDLVTLTSKKKNIEIKIFELLNLPVNTRAGNVIFINPYKITGAPEDLYPVARQKRQELKALRHQINKVQNMIELAESMVQEPFTLGLSTYEDEAVKTVGSDSEKLSFQEKTMAAMTNQSPAKPWYGIDDPWLRQTRQKLLSLKQALVDLENSTDRKVRDSWFYVDKNKRELELYKKRILPLSKSALDVSTREYESGSIPFSQAIGSYTYWLKVKLTVVKKQADLGSSIAALENIIGKSFVKY